MSLHDDLLGQARQLAVKEPKRPLQASLRRAVSASYYGLFHLLVHDATRRMFPGRGRAVLRYCMARAFIHGDMKRVAQQFSNDNVSPKLAPGLNGQALQPELIGVATAFVDLQQARHEADYDTARRFTRREVLDLLERAEQAFANWRLVRRSIQADIFFGRIACIREHANLSVRRFRADEHPEITPRVEKRQDHCGSASPPCLVASGCTEPGWTRLRAVTDQSPGHSGMSSKF